MRLEGYAIVAGTTAVMAVLLVLFIWRKSARPTYVTPRFGFKVYDPKAALAMIDIDWVAQEVQSFWHKMFPTQKEALAHMAGASIRVENAPIQVDGVLNNGLTVGHGIRLWADPALLHDGGMAALLRHELGHLALNCVYPAGKLESDHEMFKRCGFDA